MIINNKNLTLHIEGKFSRPRRDGIRDLFAGILMMAWEDSRKGTSISNMSCKRGRKLDIHLARSFLTGNYSRERFLECCRAIDIDPNKIINISMKQKWSKDYKPRYFKYD